MRQESGFANLLDMKNMDISPIQKINIKKSIKQEKKIGLVPFANNNILAQWAHLFEYGHTL